MVYCRDRLICFVQSFLFCSLTCPEIIGPASTGVFAELYGDSFLDEYILW